MVTHANTDGDANTADTEARRISRRGALQLAAVAVASLALAACGEATGPTTTASSGATVVTGGTSAAPTAASGGAATTPAAAMAGAVKRGGRIVEASVLANPGWDVHLANTVVAGHVMVFECLLRYVVTDDKTSKFELRPGLAEKWEQPDPQTVILTLRKGVKFHDGSDLTAEVVKWNLDRVTKEPKAAARSQLAVIESIEAPDATTVRVKLKTPSAAILALLSDGAGHTRAIISKAQFEKVGADDFNRNPSGTGPMRLKQYIQDDRAILEPFKDYWDKGADGKALPYLDEFVTRYIPDTATALVELQSGGVDIVKDLPPRDVASVRMSADLAFQEFPWAATQYLNFGFNVEKPPFNDVRVRQAVLFGMDREAMVKAVGFGSGAALRYSYFMPGSIGYDEALPTFRYNPDKAKQLLTEAGFGNGIDFEMKYIQREPDTTSVQLQQQVWAKLGIRVKLAGLERLAWVEDMKVKKFETGAWRGSMPFDPDLLKNQIATGGSANFTQFADPEIDRLMTEAGAILDTKQRTANYGKVITRLYEQAYIGPGYQVPTIYGYRKNLRGFTLLYNNIDYRAVWRA